VREAIAFTVPGMPIGKGRPRISTRGGFARAYTPAKTVAFESLVAVKAEQAMEGRDLIEGPVAMTLNISLPVAQSWSGKKKAAALAGTLRPCGRPDIDNFTKAIADGCNGVVYRDDSQIVLLNAAKRYAETPGVFVEVRSITDGGAA
jgi:Holliday junction resolvase RusA-like endonuclease